MKLMLYGGMANNLYVFGKTLHEAGFQVEFIRDKRDCFVFSQPFWEDVATVMSYEDIHEKVWSESEWRVFESQKGWNVPDWFVEACSSVQAVEHYNPKPSFVSFFRSVLYHSFIKKCTDRLGIVKKMQACDCSIVCGAEAEILAWYSQKPYIIWPHGGDIRMAAGLVPFDGASLKGFLSYWFYRFFLNFSFKNSLSIGTHDPKGISGTLGDISYPIDFLPIPVFRHERLPARIDRHRYLNDVLSDLGVSLPVADMYCFIPSRINFFWKKTDVLIRAIRRLNQNAKMHFIFSGWGDDYLKVKESLNPSVATFLPFALSKPFLFDLFKSVDLVIDQFVMGTYGTSMVEAASCGAPVMMYIEEEKFKAKGWPVPPVINVHTEDDMYESLSKVLAGITDLHVCSQSMLEWFNEVHHKDAVIPALKKILRRLDGQCMPIS